MKRCPECRRDYYDDSLLYCLDDGNALLEGPATEAETAAYPSSLEPGAEPTQILGRDRATGESAVSAKPKKLLILIAAAALLIVIGGIGFVAYKYKGTSEAADQPFQKFTVTRVSTSGKDQEANISPDGKYIVYLQMKDDGDRGLYVKQTATGNVITIVPPTKGNILKGTTFSPDGNYVYYLFTDRTRPTSLYQVSSVGGPPKKVLDVCHSSVTFSPDGRRIAFTRFDGGANSSVFTANADGTDERRLASLSGNEYFNSSGPSWSPDGKTIAVTVGALIDGIESMKLVGVNTGSGAVSDLSSKRWVAAERLVWMPDGKSVIVLAFENTSESGAQVWRVGYPSGEATRVTNDVNGYDDTSLGVTADGRTLLVVTSQRFSRIETVPANGDSSRPLRISTSDANQDGFHGLAFAPDGRIVFSSFEGGQQDIWIMNADGSGRVRLTSDVHQDVHPAGSPDGKYIVFRSNRPDGAAVLRLWRMNLDGTNAVQLAARVDSPHDISSDSRSVIFGVWANEMQSLNRIPIEGGEPERLTDYAAWQPEVSPNGESIGSYFINAQNAQEGYAVMSAMGGPPLRIFDFPGFQYEWVRWAPDGKSLSHIGAPPDPSNIWLQPVDGGPPRKLTNFTTDYIFRHAWSLDGRTLGLVRGRPAFDVVLFKDDK